MGLTQRLALLEDRLDRLLIAGFQQAGPDRERLLTEAEAIVDLGLASLADRLRAVATAPGPMESLATVSLASAQLRMIRSQLPTTGEGWQPLRPTAAKKSATASLLPISQVSLEGAPVWSAVRLRGAYGVELLLLEAEGLKPLEAIKGELTWAGRYPLGGGSSIERLRLGPWAPEESESDRLNRLFPGGKVKAGTPVLGYGALLLDQLQPADLRTYAWIDPAHLSLLESFVTEPTWALLWQQNGLVVPLSLADLSWGEVRHLLPNLPAERCPVLRAP